MEIYDKFLPVNYKIFINYPLNSCTEFPKSILFIITGDALPHRHEYFNNVRLRWWKQILIKNSKLEKFLAPESLQPAPV